MNPHSRCQSPHAFGGGILHAHGFALSGGHHPQGVGGACASTVHAWGVGSALPSEKHASFMQHMLLFSVFFRPDHSSKVGIFGTRRTFFFCVVHVTFALLYTTRKYALRTANILGRLPKYSATADLTTCPPWARVLEVAASRRFQADKTSQVAKIEVGVGTNFKPQES